MDARDLPDDIAAALADTVVLHRDDATDLAGALRHAGAVLTRVAGDPAAEAAYRELTDGADGELSAFALDLLVHAEALSDMTDPEKDSP
ncbi:MULTISPECIES: hypothetical protein [unclassified Frankia]|uniref:hypothetical protein n=1 Tax=unclassified Frankia TaxID=2632575 RepID=UPI001EF6296A|nr:MULTISPECIES: hypothetical protein [unclassified Frankia]